MKDLKERLRDKSRDKLAEHLKSSGISAEIAPRGRPEENIKGPWWGFFLRSLGIIDVAEGPISSIHVVKKDRGKDSPPQWWYIFLIPSEIPMAHNQTFKISTVRRKSFPIFGKVLEVHWNGNDWGTGLARALSEDQQIDAFVSKTGDVSIRSHKKEFHGWLIRTKRFDLTSDDWKALQKVVGRLLYIAS